MTALAPGRTAPNFSLKGIDGSLYSLNDDHKPTLMVAAFFKTECPVCELTFPFLERIHKAYSSDAVKILGIAENDAHEAKQFAKEYHLSFPIALDDHPYAVSSQYGLTSVPSVFLIDPNGKILQTLVGFDKPGLTELSKAIAQKAGQPAFSVFTKSDNVPDFKPG